MLGLSLCLLPCAADEWLASHATARQIQAAQWRWDSAQRLAPHREQFRRIAAQGIVSAEDEQMARLAAAVLAVDIYLQEDAADGSAPPQERRIP